MLHFILFVYFILCCLHSMWFLHASKFVISWPKDCFLGCLTFCLISFPVSTHICFCFICNQAHGSCFPLIGRAAIWVLWSDIWMHLRINEINCWGKQQGKQKLLWNKNTGNKWQKCHVRVQGWIVCTHELKVFKLYTFTEVDFEWKFMCLYRQCVFLNGNH